MKPATQLAPTGFRSLAAEPFRLFQNRVARLFEEPFGVFPFPEETLSMTAWVPPCDVFETEKELVIKAELPELRKEDVVVNLENNILTIRGERKFEEETRRENYHRVERKYGEFMRSFTLPGFVDTTKIVAEFKDGVLTLIVPKREEAKPKQIDIKIK